MQAFRRSCGEAAPNSGLGVLGWLQPGPAFADTPSATRRMPPAVGWRFGVTK